MPQLKQPVLVDLGVGLGRSAVDADRLVGLAQIVNPQQHPIDPRFHRRPGVGLGPPIQQVRQPIIAEVQRANRLAHTRGQRVEALGDPRLDMRQTVIPLRGDKHQPHPRHLAKAQRPLPQTMRRKVLVQQGGNLHLLDLRPQHGQVVHVFHFNQANEVVQHRGVTDDPP